MNWPLACSILIAATATAHADSAKLEAARKAIEDVRYDDASTLLGEALADGANSPAALTEIYQLSASTAVVLGQSERASKYFRAWLSLDPKAEPPTETAEKFRAPFIAAQAYVKEHGAIVIRIGKRDDRSIEIAVDSDPLRLVTSAVLDGDAPAGRINVGADHRIILPVPKGRGIVHVQVLDRYGNHVVERAFATFSELRSDYVLVDNTPFVRKWQLWSTAAVGLAVVGLYFGRQADMQQTHLDEIAGSKATYFYSDVTRTIDERDHDARIANTLFIGTALCAVTAGVMYAVQPPGRWVFAPRIEGAPGLAMVGTF